MSQGRVPEPIVAIASLAPGVTFAREFRVVRPLGQGGMGAVYEVEQLRTGKSRALKLMQPTLVVDEKSRERFVREARATAGVESDHVVEVVDAGIDPDTGSPWICMELLRGESLADRLDRTGILKAAEALTVFRQLAHALGAAHGAGLVHRDLKPENLFLADARRDDVPFTLKVLDFGLAKLVHEAKATRATTVGLGSPMWMAPEQADAGRVSPATDVWAVGLVAFRVLTGFSYWRAAVKTEGTLSELLTEILVHPLEPASARAEGLGVPERLPAGFDGWFERCIARQPAARFPDAATCLAALERLLDPGGTPRIAASTSPFAAVPPVAAAAAPAVAAFSDTVATSPVAARPARAATVPVSRAAADGVAAPDAAVETRAPVAARPDAIGSGTPGPAAASPESGPIDRRESGSRTPGWVWPAVAGTAVAVAVTAFLMGRSTAPAAAVPPPSVLAATPPATGAEAGTGLPAGSDAGADDVANAGEENGQDAIATSAPDVAADPDVPAEAGESPGKTGVPEAGPDAEAIEAEAEAEATRTTRTTSDARTATRPRPRPPSTPEARHFYNTIVFPCWRDRLESGSRPDTRVKITVGYNMYLVVDRVRIEGTDDEVFRRCVVNDGTRLRFQTMPEDPEIVIDVLLEGNR
jgi:tRNA A-37 threonylcarbamoyl transferase component Bud32